MRIAHFILGFTLFLCTLSVAQARQLENIAHSTKTDHSIVRNFAAALDSQTNIPSFPKQANLTQLLHNVTQLKSQPRSTEELQVLASINSRPQNYFASSNSFTKFNAFIQSLFGS